MEAQRTQVFKSNAIGRDRELAQFDAVLKERKPMLIAVTGEPGMGKTTLLRSFRARATSWKVPSSTSFGLLRVTSTTTEATFCSHTRRLLGISDDGDTTSIPSHDLAGEYKNTRANQSKQAPDRQYKNSRSIRWISPEKGQQPPPNLHPLVKQLYYLAPVLLLIDGYQPGTTFVTWFRDHFIADLRQTNAPIVVVVADTHLPDLPIDKQIRLGPLDEKAVSQRLKIIGRQMVPQLESTELTIYVEAACSEPGLLESLERVLDLAIQQE